MRHHIASHVTMRILLIPSLRQNPRDDLWVLDLETLAWTEVRTLGVPPPPGLGACCLTQTGRDLVVTKDKIAALTSGARATPGFCTSETLIIFAPQALLENLFEKRDKALD